MMFISSGCWKSHILCTTLKKNLDLYYFNTNIPAKFKGADSRPKQENLLQVLWTDEKKNSVQNSTLICIGKIIVFRELLQ